jgi:hypothetical protein
MQTPADRIADAATRTALETTLLRLDGDRRRAQEDARDAHAELVQASIRASRRFVAAWVGGAFALVVLWCFVGSLDTIGKAFGLLLCGVILSLPLSRLYRLLRMWHLPEAARLRGIETRIERIDRDMGETRRLATGPL